MNNQIKIILVDDHPIFRIPFSSVISEHYDVIAQGENGFDAISLNQKYNPDLLIIDIDMPEMNGLDAVKEIRKTDKTVKIIVLTGKEDDDLIAEADEYVQGYFLKSCQPEEIIDSIQEVMQYKSVYGAKVKERIYAYRSAHRVRLSDKQKECLKLASQGKSRQEIAAELNVSINTVHNHFQRIFEKLDVNKTTEAIQKYYGKTHAA